MVLSTSWHLQGTCFCGRTNSKQQAIKKSIALVQVTLCLAVAIKLMKHNKKKINDAWDYCWQMYMSGSLFQVLGSSQIKNEVI